MSRKLAVKKLTASDLTLFEWHFKNKNAGNQKAINLNADIFINVLYPILPELAVERGGRIPLDLHIYGPGKSSLLNLQRKIIKFGTYKNWRLNGEFIYNPADSPERFNILAPGDLVIIEFNGIDIPTSAKAVFISNSVEIDKPLFAAFDKIGGNHGMISLAASQIETIIDHVKPPLDHPIHELTVASELEDLIVAGQIDLKKLQEKPSLRKISKEDLLKAKRAAEDNGMRGEELINNFFYDRLEKGLITDYLWESDINPIYPYDFHYTVNGEKCLIEVKTTEGAFERDFYFSINELRQAAEAPRYHLYRVYNLEGLKASLRIAENLNEFAKKLLEIFNELPEGVKANGISMSPKCLTFGGEITLALKDETD